MRVFSNEDTLFMVTKFSPIKSEITVMNKFLLIIISGLASTDSFAGGYYHEFVPSIKFVQKSGTAKSGTSNTDTSEQDIQINLKYGYINENNVEPFLEVQHESSSGSVSTFSQENTILKTGLGVLFNIPVGKLESNDEKKDKKEKKKRLSRRGFKGAKHIPYGGLVISQESTSKASGITSKSTTTGSSLTTKFIAGTRYVLFPHVAFNFSLKAYFETGQDSSESPEATEKFEGATNHLALEFDLLSISLFF